MIYQLLDTGYMMNRVPNLDEYLEMVGLWRKLVPRDGRCLFRSIGEQIFGNQNVADQLMETCASYLEENNERFLRHLSHPVDQYLASVRKAQNCAAHPHLDVFLEIISNLYNCAILIYHQSSGQPTCIVTSQNHPRTIELCKIGKHYDTVMTRTRVSAYAQCQSLLFDLLYSRVFDMPEEEIDFGVSALRHKVNKRKDSVCEGMSLENADDSGHGADSSDLSPNKMPFSYRAAKGLDINIFRNIAFDIWREENIDRAVGDQLLVPGNQCIVQLSDISEDDVVDSEAIIQDFDDETQLVSAFVQSLGMRVEVPRENIKSISDRGGFGVSLEMTKSSNKRKFGVKQDVHWHNRPEHPKHLGSPNVMYWSNSNGSCFNPIDSSNSERSIPSQGGPTMGPRHMRDRGVSESTSQGQLTVQVSPSAFAAAAKQAGYPATQVPALMSSPTRGDHPGGPQATYKPVAKVYFNSVGKPAVCKLQLPKYSKKTTEENTGDIGRTAKDNRQPARLRCSSESAAGGPSPPQDTNSNTSVRSPIVSSYRPVPLQPASTQPLMTLPMVPPPGQELHLLSYRMHNVPFVNNMSGPVDMSADYSKDPMGRDLPHSDISTMRYFYNFGIQCFRMNLSQPFPSSHASSQWIAQGQTPQNVVNTQQRYDECYRMNFSQALSSHTSTQWIPAAGQTPQNLVQTPHQRNNQSVRVVPLMDLGPSYYPISQGLDGTTVMAPSHSTGPLQDGVPASPTQVGALSGPPPSWAYHTPTGYCYL